MKLLTKALASQIPALYAQDDKPKEEVKVYAKFFDPSSDWTWYVTEYDPQDRLFFGYVKGFVGELGYFSLDELESVKGKFGLGIERDMHFKTCSLADVMSGKVS